MRSFPVAAPADRVWAVMRDVERWPEWTASVSSVRVVGGGPIAVGSRVRIRQPKLPPAEWTVTDIIENRGFTWVNRAPGSRIAGHHYIDPEGSGVRVTLGLDYEGPVARLVALLTRRLTEEYVEMEGQGLKARAEQRAR